MSLDAFTRGLRRIGRAGRASPRGPGHAPASGPRPSLETAIETIGQAHPAALRRCGSAHALDAGRRSQAPAISTPMVTLAWQVLERPADTRAAIALAQTILKATGDLA